MNKKSIPGWTINIDEISSGVFKVTLTDAYGRKAEIIDDATDQTIVRAISDAFEIEKVVSKNWNLFLYDLCIQQLEHIDIKTKEYNDEAFGSWFIEREDNRLVYDGKDSLVIFKTKSKNDWIDIEIIKFKELKYVNFARQMKMLIENTHYRTLSKAGQGWWQKLFGYK